MQQLKPVVTKAPFRLSALPLFSNLGVQSRIGWGLAIVLIIAITSVCAPWLTPFNPIQNDLLDVLQKPSLHHWFGTDNFGRDIFSRVLYAGRTDLEIGVISVLVPIVVGTILGLITGYFGGWLSTLIMRLVDVVISFPFLVLIIAIIAILGPGLTNMYIAIFLVGWSSYTRIVRAEVLVIKQQEFIIAARSIGYGSTRILLRHILPNVISPALIYAMSDVVLCILLGASLSFLGLGVQPPTPEWGSMIAEGRNYIVLAWWIPTLPGIFVILTGLGFSLLGDGLAEKLERD